MLKGEQREGKQILIQKQGKMRQPHSQFEGLQWVMNDPEFSAGMIKIFCVSGETVAPHYCRLKA